MKKLINIAVIMTCYNRCFLTVDSLRSLFSSRDAFQSQESVKVILHIFLTDDGCTDSTVETVTTIFPGENIHIVAGTGSLYWAGGMCKAWNAALEQSKEWDYYLLLNDDTCCMSCALEELLFTQQFLKSHCGSEGLVSGVCVDNDRETITYGAEYYSRTWFGKSLFMKPTGRPEPCYRTNANLVLVSQSVVEKIGIFDTGFVHSCADWAYGIRANKAGLPVYITAKPCAICSFDHDSVKEEGAKVLKMNIAERKEFFNHPLRSTSDKLLFMKRYYKEKYLVLYIVRQLAIYWPCAYYKLLLSRVK